MRKSIVICCALMLACSSAAVLTACGSDDDTQEMFATYETWQDGFYNINMMDGFGRISRSDEQAHGGSYSAKLQPLGSHTDGEAPYFYYPMQIEGGGGYDYTDFSRLDNISFWMYNAESEEVSFDLCIVASVADVYGTDCKTVQEVKLAPGVWTEVIYRPDYDALQDMCDITNVAGFAFRFENQGSADIADAPVLYLDDLSLGVSDEPLTEIKTSTPARGEIQSFDLASSMVYVRLQSGLDYSESYLAAGSDKLPQGAKGGIEFTVTDAEMGSWPRLHFDSRTAQSALQEADRFSLMLYFGTSDPAVTEAELHMFPDTSSEYVEYVKTNTWVKVTIDSETMLNNWGDSIGVRSLGLFWLQNGGSSCFNAIDVVRVADIRAEFDEVRIPDMPAGSVGTAYTLPDASLEIDGTKVTAESWSYSVSYKNAALCGDGYPAIQLSGKAFTPQTGGTFVAEYTATYQGKTYKASAEFEVARAAAAEGELESFDDPAVLDGIRMNSGTGVEYTSPEYLWAGSDKLPAGAKGGVEYTIPAVEGGTWPRFYFNSRISSAEIAKYDTVTFDIYLEAPDHDETVLIKMYPETQETDKYVRTNTWVTVTLNGEQCADLISRVATGSVGFFWVQNGARETGKVNIIDHIRITNIRAFNMDAERGEAAETEVELFDDKYSVAGLTVSDAWVEWDETEQAAVATVSPSSDLWLNVSLTARRSLEDYKALQAQGYNAVSLELYLEPAEGSTARNAQMNYWAQNEELNASQASVAIGEWVTLTFDLDTYLKALEGSENGAVKLFWVASANRGETLARLCEMRIRNVQLVKAEDAVKFGTGAEDFFLLDSPENSASHDYFAAGSSEIPSGVPAAVAQNGAVRMSLAAGSESWPHLKFSADRNMFAEGNTLTVTLYIKSTSNEPLSVRQWPHGSDWIVKGEIPVNQWVEFKVDAEVLRSVYNWAPSYGIEYSDLLWFTNAGGNTVSEVWIAGLRVSQEESVSFEESGIEMENTDVLMKDGNAWFGIVSKQGYAYKLTVKKGDTVLQKGTDYTVSDQDASVTLVSPEAGAYTFCFESYGGRFASGSYTVTVRDYEVVVDQPADGTTGSPVTLPQGMLQGKDTVTQGISWTFTVTHRDAALYQSLFGTIEVEDMQFTPQMAGEYTIVYTAAYNGKQYTAEKLVTVSRAAAKEGEIESFDDAASLDAVQLGDYKETYLLAGDEKLPADAEGGVSFEFPNELSWPDLFVTARDNASLDGYSDVVLRVYVASTAERVELRQQNGGDVIFAFKSNEWVELRISADEYAAFMAGDERICFVQNADENNLITELRIAGVYAVNVSDAETVLDMNTFGARIDKVWGNDEMGINSRNYVDASAVPAGMPEGSDYAVEATISSKEASTYGWLYIRPSKTLEELRALQQEGYNAVTLNFYVQTADSSLTKTQVAFFPEYDNTATLFAMNKWNSVTLGLDQFIAQMDASEKDDLLPILWVEAPQSSEVTTVYFSGFELSKEAPAALLELNTFGNSVFDEKNILTGGWGDGILENYSGSEAYWSNALIDAENAPAGRAFHIGMKSDKQDGSLYMHIAGEAAENPFTALQTDYDTVRVSFYIVPAEDGTSGQVQFTVNTTNTKVDVGEWVTVDLDLSDVAAYCKWNEGSNWWQWQLFYFYYNGTTVTDIYVSGFTLLKTQG